MAEPRLDMEHEEKNPLDAAPAPAEEPEKNPEENYAVNDEGTEADMVKKERGEQREKSEKK